MLNYRRHGLPRGKMFLLFNEAVLMIFLNSHPGSPSATEGPDPDLYHQKLCCQQADPSFDYAQDDGTNRFVDLQKLNSYVQETVQYYGHDDQRAYAEPAYRLDHEHDRSLQYRHQ